MRFETSAGMARFLHNAKTSQGWAQDDAEAGLGDASHWWVMRDPSSGGAEGAGPADVAENHGHAGDDVHEGDHDHAGEHDHAEGEVCALPALSPGFLISSILNGTAWKPAPQAAPEAITFDPTVNLSAMPANGVGVAYGDTFKLHSNPGSQFRVYLDFDGHTTTGTSWNSYWGVSSIVSPAFSTSDGSPNFSATELSAIQQVWQRVAEDFAPFNIDVTTEDPGVEGLRYGGTGDTAYGIRVVITDEDGKNYGGIAYVGSFDWNSDTPAYVYSNRLSDVAAYIAEAASHEAGHTLGLSHDGQNPTSQSQTDYYYGHGSGATDWAPIMGVGYNAVVTQWSKGEYLNSTQKQDDLAIVTSQNGGVTYRADDFGNAFASAASLSGALSGSAYQVVTYGLISGSGTLNDVDVFSLNVASGGSVNLSLAGCTPVFVTGGTGYQYVPLSATNLDIRACLYDLAGNLIVESNSTAVLGATVSASGLSAGTYYLTVDGVGFGSPLASPPTGYTDYGSLGNYMITGSYTYGGGSGGGGGGGGGGSTPPSLSVSAGSVATSEEGSTASFTLSAANATAPIVVNVSGLNAAEGQLRTASGATVGSTVTLDASNGWSLGLVLAGRDDRSDDGNKSYTLSFAASGTNTVGVVATNVDDEIAPASTGAKVGAWRTSPTITSGNSLASITGDDTTSLVLREGQLSGSSNYRMDWMWKFTGLASGAYGLHLDATSSGENFVFRTSSDKGASWTALGASARTWAGDFALGTVSSGELWVEVIDGSTGTDRTRNTISVDLLTIETVGVPTGGALAAADLMG